MTPDTPAPATEAWMREAAAIAACDRYPDTIREEKRIAAIIARHHASRPVAPTARPSQPAAPDALGGDAHGAPTGVYNAPVIPSEPASRAAPDVAALARDLAEEINKANLPTMSAFVTTTGCNLARERIIADILTPALSALVSERDAAVKERNDMIAANDGWKQLVAEKEAALAASREREGKLREALKESDACLSRMVRHAQDYMTGGFPMPLSRGSHDSAEHALDRRIKAAQLATAALLTQPPAGTEEKR